MVENRAKLEIVSEEKHTRRSFYFADCFVSSLQLAEELLKRETLNYEDMVKLIGPPPFPDKQKLDIIDWDDTGCSTTRRARTSRTSIPLVSTPEPSRVPPTPESLGGTGKGTAGEGPPSTQENIHFTS